MILKFYALDDPKVCKLLPVAARERLRAALTIDPGLEAGESHERTVALNDAILEVKRQYRRFFR